MSIIKFDQSNLCQFNHCCTCAGYDRSWNAGDRRIEAYRGSTRTRVLPYVWSGIWKKASETRKKCNNCSRRGLYAKPLQSKGKTHFSGETPKSTVLSDNSLFWWSQSTFRTSKGVRTGAARASRSPDSEAGGAQSCPRTAKSGPVWGSNLARIRGLRRQIWRGIRVSDRNFTSGATFAPGGESRGQGRKNRHSKPSLDEKCPF